MAGEVELTLGDLLEELRVGTKLGILDTMKRNLEGRGATQEEANRVALNYSKNVDRKVNQGKWKKQDMAELQG
jgi:hypothetical protein